MTKRRRWSRALFLAVVLPLACDKGDESGQGDEASGNDCWDRDSAEACQVAGDVCEFVGSGLGRYADGVCTPDDTIGWCVPTPYGGATVPTVWHEPATGRVVALGFNPVDPAPGWEACPAVGGGGTTFCPSSVAACDACLCDDGEETG